MIQQALFQAAWNFLGLPEEFSDPGRAAVWVLPVPYEATTCYGAGTRNGPAAIIAASRQLERFDREFDGEPCKLLGIHTMNPLAPQRLPETMLDAIETAVAGVLQGDPAPRLPSSPTPTSGGGQNARIARYVLPKTGIYYVRAARFSGKDGNPNTHGSFVLVLAKLAR